MTLWYLVPFPVPLRRGVRESSNAYLTVLEAQSQLHDGKGTGDGTPPSPAKELGRRVLDAGEGAHRISPQLFCLAGGGVGGTVSCWLGTLRG